MCELDLVCVLIFVLLLKFFDDWEIFYIVFINKMDWVCRDEIYCKFNFGEVLEVFKIVFNCFIVFY